MSPPPPPTPMITVESCTQFTPPFVCCLNIFFLHLAANLPQCEKGLRAPLQRRNLSLLCPPLTIQSSCFVPAAPFFTSHLVVCGAGGHSFPIGLLLTALCRGDVHVVLCAHPGRTIPHLAFDPSEESAGLI